MKLTTTALVWLTFVIFSVKGQGTLIGNLKTLAHNVSGKVYAVDQQRIFIKGFTYDGTGPDAFFYVGTSGQPSHTGTKIRDENNSENILKRYDGKDIVLNLPEALKLKDIRWLSVWCRDFRVDFGHVLIPSDLSIPEPVDLGELSQLAHKVSSGKITVLDQRRMLIRSLNYDGLGPDAFFWVGKTANPDTSGEKIPDENGSTDKLKAYNGDDVTLTLPVGKSWKDYKWLSLWCKLAKQDFGNVKIVGVDNVPPHFPPTQSGMSSCETLDDYFNVAWEITGDKIVFELTGSLDTSSGYMSFGISGSDTSSVMIGGDVAVASYENQPKIEDYYLQGKAYCSGSTGVCTDTSFGGKESLTLLGGSYTDGITTIRYERPLKTGDSQTDKDITSGEMYVIWALGKLNNLGVVTIHDQRMQGDKKINFGRSSLNNCRAVKRREEKQVDAWTIPEILGSTEWTIVAEIGPAGGKKGYTAITGKQSWGIAWYLNGILIPKLVVKRGDTFTFKVFGGDNKDNSAKYHPFYITNDPKGGYADKTSDEKKGVQIYAGLSSNGNVTVGPYCEYQVTSSTKNADDYSSFESYFKTLNRACDSNGEPGMFTWTPDAQTPDKVYYQCYTHQYLGWEIIVVDDYADYMNTSNNVKSIPILSMLSFFLLVLVLLKDML